jgi:uncharacterized protein
MLSRMISAKKTALLAALLVLGLIASVTIAGVLLVSPVQAIIGDPPPALSAQPVEITSPSGATLHGWMAEGRPGGGFVVLMHGIRANRLAMVRRALVLKEHGFGVLLFDFQAHGESVGRHITLGHLESLDAAAAAFARELHPGEKVGAIGVSLGGAASLLGPQPLHVDALVLESVYSDIHPALTNRLRGRLGRVAGPVVTPVVAPLLEMLMPPVLGVDLGALRPVDRIGGVTAPVLVASGSIDPYTPIAEAQALFAHAPAPKQFWPVAGAGHVDLERYDSAAYWDHVLPFLTGYLQAVAKG